MVIKKPRLKLYNSGKTSVIDDGTISISSLANYAAPATPSVFDGEKFLGGFGETKLHEIDYWTLRARSAQLFNDNLYAKGLIRRLVTNEINTGLMPEAYPDESILKLKEGTLNHWADLTENRWNIWCKSPHICDFYGRSTFGAIQRSARMEALISGDVLVVLRQNSVTQLPQVQLVSGSNVRTPYDKKNKPAQGNKIKHGVEINKQGRHVAFWIKQDDGSFKRLPAYVSDRKSAWLVYGTERRLDEVRGQPLLSIVLQSLKEIDRYRDSTQRKAVINSILAMFIKKSEDKIGTLPMTGGAVKRDRVEVTSSDPAKARSFNLSSHLPGVIAEELQAGEEPVLKGGEGTDVNFGEFEEAIIQAVAWANEIPPEILRLAFSNNYSASQAAINEFKIYLNLVWSHFGESFCSPIYAEWLISEVLAQRIKADGFLQSWRNPSQFDVFGAWMMVEWYGSIKPSTDMLKQGKASKILVSEGWSTNAREARITTGTKYGRNITRLKRENEQKVEAMRPLAEFYQQYGISESTTDLLATNQTNIQTMIGDQLEEALADSNEE